MAHLFHQQPNKYQFQSTPHTIHGYSLLQLLITLAIILTLIAIAFPYYRQHVQQAKLHQAQAVLLTNSQYLAKHYQQHISYKKNKNSWPHLPISQNQHFCFRFQGNPRFTRKEHYTLKAVALDTNTEPRILKLNQDGRVFLCQSSTSRCNEKNNFFSGGSQTDKNCQIFNH
ncbi:type IV pilin protein [Snodgrassella alvi]|jgi:type IV pilus assembly protein PilE|uniref:type IV pilin protein n=1 Tax=Snodgrassella alvi TaxID=1196083 RepID=UPI000C1EB6E3|nr:type IV pilin protein [Snodgrassella alvi]